jgi:hypothetical protein
MRVIIAGSRWIEDRAALDAAVAKAGFDITEVITSNSRGVDRLAEIWAREKGVPFRVFPVEWSRFGGRAGIMRDQQMADHAEALIALWDGYSTGTAQMIEIAKHRGLETYVHIWNPHKTRRVTKAARPPTEGGEPT